ncbi:hypothetical protein LPJ75_003896, partial [Coemansia sp. RSA 2598]
EPFDNYRLQMGNYSPLPPPLPPTAQLSLASQTFTGFATFAPAGPTTSAIYPLATGLPQQQQQQQVQLSSASFVLATYTVPAATHETSTLYKGSTSYSKNIFSRPSVSIDEIESLGSELLEEYTDHSILDGSDAQSSSPKAHQALKALYAAAAAATTAGLALM